MMRSPKASLLLPWVAAPVLALNSTFYNPMLPGWHSDPSCIFVPEVNNTFFCVTSSFVVFPGCPVYASKDLMNWRLASFGHNRESQFPSLGTTSAPDAGYWAATIRYNNGTFYVITEWSNNVPFVGTALLFKTKDPFNNSAWDDPITFKGLPGIDPDLFWDDDGQAYVASGCINLQTIDLDTGKVGPNHVIWKGSGSATAEGPHVYKKDGFYYGLCAEGGTGLSHEMTISRSSSLIPSSGLYQSYSSNPILTNRGSQELFQTVGHGDLFQDQYGQWWGVALSTRCGPTRSSYPMGRETVLYSVTWPTGGWPRLSPVRGTMSGWPLPPLTQDVRGEGPFIEASDNFTFPSGSALPGHFRYWRFPMDNAFIVSPPGHPNTLQINPSNLNPSGNKAVDPTPRLSLILREQTDTKYTYSIDVVNFDAKAEEAEVGVTAFCSQTQHFDLGLVLLPLGNGTLGWNLRFRATTPSNTVVTKPVPSYWLNESIRLIVQAISDTEYQLSAASVLDLASTIIMGTGPASGLSGGDCRYSGSLVGAYATTNGGDADTTPAYVTNWMYSGKGQAISGAVGDASYVPFTPYTG